MLGINVTRPSVTWSWLMLDTGTAVTRNLERSSLFSLCCFPSWQILPCCVANTISRLCKFRVRRLPGVFDPPPPLPPDCSTGASRHFIMVLKVLLIDFAFFGTISNKLEKLQGMFLKSPFWRDEKKRPCKTATVSLFWKLIIRLTESVKLSRRFYQHGFGFGFAIEQ